MRTYLIGLFANRAILQQNTADNNMTCHDCSHSSEHTLPIALLPLFIGLITFMVGLVKMVEARAVNAGMHNLPFYDTVDLSRRRQRLGRTLMVAGSLTAVGSVIALQCKK